VGVLMYFVLWVVDDGQMRPVEREKSVFNNLDALMASCAARLQQMREKHKDSPPDGFIVFDAADKELFRWLAERVAQPETPASQQV
jgi:hypothetical protein